MLTKNAISHQIVSRLQQSGVDCSLAQATAMQDALLQIVEDAVVTDGACRLYGLGTLQLVRRAAHTGRDLRTGGLMTVPAHNTVILRPAARLRDRAQDAKVVESEASEEKEIEQ